jgi:hypothetical protein
MKRKFARALGVGLLPVVLTACGGGVSTGTLRPTPPSNEVATAQILAQARIPSETAEAYAVNSGAVVFTDTSETTEPIAVDGG